jgi:hypothetical protein
LSFFCIAHPEQLNHGVCEGKAAIRCALLGWRFGSPSRKPNRTSSSASGAPGAVQTNKWSNSMRMRASLEARACPLRSCVETFAEDYAEEAAGIAPESSLKLAGATRLECVTSRVTGRRAQPSAWTNSPKNSDGCRVPGTRSQERTIDCRGMI